MKRNKRGYTYQVLSIINIAPPKLLFDRIKQLSLILFSPWFITKLLCHRIEPSALFYRNTPVLCDTPMVPSSIRCYKDSKNNREPYEKDY
ncbi:hypothetical protein [Prevotella sp.]